MNLCKKVNKKDIIGEIADKLLCPRSFVDHQIIGKNPTIEKVIFNPPATVVFWSDGTKTVAKCSECSKWRMADGSCSCKRYARTCSFDKHVGLAVACARKAVPDFVKVMRDACEDGEK